MVFSYRCWHFVITGLVVDRFNVYFVIGGLFVDRLMDFVFGAHALSSGVSS